MARRCAGQGPSRGPLTQFPTEIVHRAVNRAASQSAPRCSRAAAMDCAASRVARSKVESREERGAACHRARPASRTSRRTFVEARLEERDARAVSLASTPRGRTARWSPRRRAEPSTVRAGADHRSRVASQARCFEPSARVSPYRWNATSTSST